MLSLVCRLLSAARINGKMMGEYSNSTVRVLLALSPPCLPSRVCRLLYAPRINGKMMRQYSNSTVRIFVYFLCEYRGVPHPCSRPV
jgi:hypothetical protein